MVCLLNSWKIKVGKVGRVRRVGKPGKEIETIIKLIVEKAVKRIFHNFKIWYPNLATLYNLFAILLVGCYCVEFCLWS
jgi:hypothetical protein